MKKKLNILITGGGAPGIAGTIYSLRHNVDNRDINIITTDMHKDVTGKYLSDNFYLIPAATEKNAYLEKLIEICKKENIDIIIPQNTAELSLLAESKSDFEKYGTKIMVSGYDAIAIANDKYKLMQICEKAGLPVAGFYMVDNFAALREKAVSLGFPAKPIVVKPPHSNGMRGVRIVHDDIELKSMFYSEKPSIHITMDLLQKILGEQFPELIVMEYLPGTEYTVDVFRSDEDMCIVPRTRDIIKSGITFSGKLEKNRGIIDITTQILNEIDLKFCFGFQYKLDENKIPKILECNPRVQGTMIMSTMAGANIIYAAVKSLLDEKIPSFNIDWNYRFYRYWGGLGFNDHTGNIDRLC